MSTVSSRSRSAQLIVQAVQVQRARRGQQFPIGVETASAVPDSRSTIHFSTRMFSPKPGQTNFPCAFLRNQLT